MSWQAYHAVAQYSRYRHDGTDPDPVKHATMLALAEHADATGQVGKAGDYKSCPSHSTLAGLAGVHRNTISKLLAAIENDGEIKKTASGGGGRYRWRVYQINLPLPAAPASETAETRPFANELAEATVDAIAQSIAEKGAIYVQLKKLIDDAIAQAIAQDRADRVQLTREEINSIAQSIAQQSRPIAQSIAQNPGEFVQDPLDPIDLIDPIERGGADYAQQCWDGTKVILKKWGEKRSITGGFSDRDPKDTDDYIKPAMKILNRAEGNPEKAWEDILEAYRTFGSGYKPTRLAPIWRKIQEKDEPAPPANGNGSNHGRSEQTETQKRTAAIIAEMGRGGR